MNGNNFGMIVGEVRVSGVNGTNGNAPNFIDQNKVTDNGFPVVSINGGLGSDAYAWVNVFGGNPGWVFDSNNPMKPQSIEAKVEGNVKFTGASLSKIANASGAYGGAFGHERFSGDPDYYIPYSSFITTARPTGSVDALKTQYKQGETVEITINGTDFSGYDKGIEVVNLAIDFPDHSARQVFKGNYNGSSVTNPGTPFTFSDMKTFVLPPDAPLGTYTVRYIIQDFHHRSTQGSPSISSSLPYTDQFEVIAGPGGGGGTCTPIQATLKITGQSDQTLSSGTYQMPTGKNTISNITFPTSGTLKVGTTTIGTGMSFNNILVDTDRTLTFTPADSTKCTWTLNVAAPEPVDIKCENCKGILHVQTMNSTGKGELNANIPSGGSEGLAPKTDYIRIDAPVKGKWLDKNGNVIPFVSNRISDRYFINDSYSGQDFYVMFVSDDGTVCWCKTFYSAPEAGDNQCPLVSGGDAGDIDVGEVITDIPLNGSLTLKARYTDLNRNVQPAMVYWKIERPDGTIAKQYWEPADKGGYIYREWDMMYVPFLKNSTNTLQRIEFDKPGDYKISIEYDTLKGQPYDDWRSKNCNWNMTVRITDYAKIECKDLSYEVEMAGKRVSLTGSGTQANPYLLKVPKGEKNEAYFYLLNKGQRNQLEAKWELDYQKGGVGNSGSVFLYEFDDPVAAPDGYTLKATVETDPNNPAQNCVTYFKIEWGDPLQFECDKVLIKAAVDGKSQNLTGNGSQAAPYRMEVVAGKEYTFDFWALLDDGNGGTTSQFASVAWHLSDGKGNTYAGTGTSFRKKLNMPTVSTYTMKATVKGKGQNEPCPDIVLIIDVRDVTCKDLYVQYKYSTDSSWSKDTGEDIVTSPGITHSKLRDGKLGLKIAVTTDYTEPSAQNTLNVTWTMTNEMTGKQVTNESGSPSAFFELADIQPGTYKLKIKVTDTSNPSFSNCELYISFAITDKNADCSNFYLHVYAWNGGNIDQAMEYHGYSGKTITLDQSTDHYLFVVSMNPNDMVDDYSSPIYVDWQAPSPWVNTPIFDGLTKWVFYQETPIPNGTYKITGKMNDPKLTAKCNFDVTIVIGKKEPEPEPCTTCNPGGEIDGGKMKLKIYDSDNRLLTSTADGVWEKEPARIEVQIEQTKLDAAFTKIDSEIERAIEDKKAEILAKYPAPGYEKVQITVKPTTWNAKSNPLTVWPGTIPLAVTGPGINRNFSLNPKLEKQSHIYDGTITPTVTTWKEILNSNDYTAKVESFAVDVPYQVNFDVSFEKCEEIDDPSWQDDPDDPNDVAPKIKLCTPGTATDTITNKFVVNVEGDQTSFEVFEPNATGSLYHTAEWSEYHARDRYPNSQPNDFYAGERILAKIELTPRHMHPFSKKYPQIVSATAWISETGQKNTSLQSTLSLQPYSATLWRGAQQFIAKLGMRETGVDTLLMGDKQKGFSKGGSYSVQFQVQFGFQTQKGYGYPNKTTFVGHGMNDYRVVFRIIANAWERQGIRNHTTQ